MAFATKPALATAMITRALDAGPAGDAAIKPTPATATTDDKQPKPHEDHHLRPEY
ncbi:hypothetical protein [Streptomyces sp. MMG1533]|uniref:hypothetical protein n=1 Tax=Streptomyces sp. MMG1533 TaxID=1415546 RepID=UPI000A6F4E8B|nr:hypothetical protein [Streptomyces sp. MMG1533]